MHPARTYLLDKFVSILDDLMKVSSGADCSDLSPIQLVIALTTSSRRLSSRLAPSLWDSTIEVGADFFQEIIRNPVLLDLNRRLAQRILYAPGRVSY